MESFVKTQPDFLVCSTFPFNYTARDNASRYAPGVQLYSDGNHSQPRGCIFPTASCTLSRSCCGQSKQHGQNITYLTIYMMAVMLLSIAVWIKATKVRLEKERKQTGAAGAREVERYTVTPAFIASAPKAVQVFWAYGFSLGIMAEVMITINLQQDIQNKLSLSNRNVQAATDAILGPLGEIFSFIEETMTVRISQAMGSNDKARTNRMVKIGVVSALVLGLAASTVATVLAFIAPVFRAIINPGVVHDHNTYSGCELLPNNTALADSTAPFWIMSAAQYPAVFLSMVLTAVMVGSGDIAGYGWMSAVSAALMPILWFGLREESEHRLTLLGIAQLAGSYATLLLPLCYVRWNPSFAARTGITCFGGSGGGSGADGDAVDSDGGGASNPPSDDESTPLWKRGGSKRGSVQSARLAPPSPAEGDRAADPTAVGGGVSINHQPASHRPQTGGDASFPGSPPTSPPSLLGELMKDGLMIMVVDLSIVLRGTIGYFIALNRSRADAYILNAASAAMPQFGWGYMLAWSFLIKIFGPRMIEQRKYDAFATMAGVAVCSAVIIGAGAVVFAEMFQGQLEVYFGESACEFAYNEPCFKLFEDIFITAPNISAVFGHAFGWATAIDCVVLVVRPALLACMDFKFLFYSSIGTFVAVFVPAVVVAVTLYDSSALAIYIAMISPIFVNAILCVARLIRNVRKMRAGLWVASSPAGARPV